MLRTNAIRRTAARQAGLCITCFAAPVETGRAVCGACNAHAAARVARSRSRCKLAALQTNMFGEYERFGDAAVTRQYYALGAEYFDECLKIGVANPADYARVAQKLSDALFFGNDPDSAKPWLERTLAASADGSHNIETNVLVLLRLARQSWLDARTPRSVPLAKQALERAQAAKSRELQVRAHLSVATFLQLLGKFDEADGHLSSAKPYVLDMPKDVQANYRCQLGIFRSKVGGRREAFAEFERAIELAKAHGDGFLLTTIWDDYANAATDHGYMQIARTCREFALLVAREGNITWRVPYLALRYAALLSLLGEHAQSRDMVVHALGYDVQTPGVRILAAAIGIPIALRLEDDVLVQRCARTDALQYAFQSEEPARLEPVLAAFAALYVRRGKFIEARTLVHRGSRLVDSRVRRACLHFVEAHSALASAQNAIADREARAAASAFRAMHWYGFADDAERMCNKPSSQSLAPAASRTVAASDPDLSPREREVARLVLAGRTNRAIAEELAISERTVESHMTSILSRLGIHSRWQLIDIYGASKD